MNGPGRGRLGGHVRWEVWGVQGERMGSLLSRSGSEISKSKGQRWQGGRGQGDRATLGNGVGAPYRVQGAPAL